MHFRDLLVRLRDVAQQTLVAFRPNAQGFQILLRRVHHQLNRRRGAREILHLPMQIKHQHPRQLPHLLKPPLRLLAQLRLIRPRLLGLPARLLRFHP